MTLQGVGGSEAIVTNPEIPNSFPRMVICCGWEGRLKVERSERGLTEVIVGKLQSTPEKPSLQVQTPVMLLQIPLLEQGVLDPPGQAWYVKAPKNPSAQRSHNEPWKLLGHPQHL